jgi:chromosome segregation ATPase
VDLRRTEAENNRLAAERGDIAQTVASLEGDLRRVKKDAEAFGRDLKLLRAAKEKLEGQRKEDEVKAERLRKQTQAQIRLLNDQLENQREETRVAKQELSSHVCKSYARRNSTFLGDGTNIYTEMVDICQPSDYSITRNARG